RFEEHVFAKLRAPRGTRRARKAVVALRFTTALQDAGAQEWPLKNGSAAGFATPYTTTPVRCTCRKPRQSANALFRLAECFLDQRVCRLAQIGREDVPDIGMAD